MFAPNANPKCKVCGKTAYQQESLTYDSQTYHKACFKCLQCGSRVSLSKVAMIQGDLYCKNCFIRMFSEKGNYNVFQERAGEAANAPADAPVAAVAAVAAGGDAPTDVEAKANANYIMSKPRRSSLLSCLMAGCSKPRAAGVNYCLEHQRAETDAESLALIKAINEKSAKDVKAVLQGEGVQLAVQPNSKRQTPLEIAFTSGSTACGVVMVEMLAERLASLQQQVRTLQEQLDVAGGDKVLSKLKSANRPRRNSAPREQIEDDLAEAADQLSDLPSMGSPDDAAPGHHTALSEALPSH